MIIFKTETTKLKRESLRMIWFVNILFLIKYLLLNF